MKYAILILICTLSFGNRSIDKCTYPNAVKAVDVRLEIRAKEKVIKRGTSPNVEVFLINKGDKLVNLVKPGDGSLSGWRTPKVMWSTRVIEMKSVPKELLQDSEKHPDGFPKQFPRYMRCGNVNGLKRSEIFTLLPNEEIKLSSWIGGLQVGHSIGKFGVKFYYENKPDIEWKGIGYNDPDALEIVRTKTAAVQLESNELIFEVVE